MRIISEKCKIMEKKIYIKPETIQFDLDKQMNMVMMTGGTGGGTGRPGRNKSAEATTTDTDELYTNPFGE